MERPLLPIESEGSAFKLPSVTSGKRAGPRQETAAIQARS